MEKEMESAQKQKIPGKSRKQTGGGDEPGDPEEIQVIGERWDQGRSRRDFDAQEAYPGDWEPEEESEGWESEYEEEVYPESWESEEDSQDWEDWEDETDDSYRKRPAYGKYGKPPGRGSRQHEGYGEITKEEFKSLKDTTEAELNKYMEEKSRMSEQSDCEGGMEFDIGKIGAVLGEVLDFSKPKLDDSIIDKICFTNYSRR